MPMIGTMTAAVIEDEPFVVAVFRAILEMREFVVLSASSAETGLHLCTDGDKLIDLVVVDRCLPGISGLRVVPEIRAKHPNVFCIFTSATPVEYWDSADLHQLAAVPENCYSFLQKPFTAQKLLATIDLWLTRKPIASAATVV
jgi:DNA-binding response OmpR family regulator